MATGLVLLTIGSVVLAQIHYDSSNWLVISALMLRGFAMGFAMMPTMSAAMARVPRRYTSRASSITNTFQRVSSSVGIAVLVTVLAAQFAPAARQASCAPPAVVVAAAATVLHRPQLTAAAVLHLPAAGRCGVVGGGELREHAASTATRSSTLQPPYLGGVFSDAFDRTFVLIAILSAMGIIPASS